jgi:hypothetical protein
MPDKIILCVGVAPERLKFLDDLGLGNYLIVVCKTPAKEAGMRDDYFKNAFTYIERDPDQFDTVSLDINKLLSMCNPPRTKIDILVYHDDNYCEQDPGYSSLSNVVLFMP